MVVGVVVVGELPPVVVVVELGEEPITEGSPEGLTLTESSSKNGF